MTMLRVSMPLRPTEGAKITRWQYRVILNSGKSISLPEFARLLKLPYPSLAKLVHTELAIIGDHVDKFIDIVQRVKRGMRKGASLRYSICPHCNGHGKIKNETQAVP